MDGWMDGWMDVRLSVRLSVAGIASKRLNVSSNLFYLFPTKPYSNILTVVLNEGGERKKLRFWTNISLYHRNDTLYGHSYYGASIGIRKRSIEWCHFQCS